MIYFQLFLSFLQIGLFSIGGGYAAMPLIQNQVVTIHNWLTLSEFTDLITISQMTPGPIAINSATFIGMRIAGLSGAIIATLGCILPSCVIVSFLAHLYYKYKNVSTIQDVLSTLRPAIVALIASAGLSILILVIYDKNSPHAQMRGLSIVGLALFLIAIVLLRKFKLNPIFVMIICGLLCFFLDLFNLRYM